MKRNGQFDRDSPPPKATFFCPDCEHSGKITEDLICQGTGTHYAYRCPECGATITSRPRTPRTNADREGGREICHSD